MSETREVNGQTYEILHSQWAVYNRPREYPDNVVIRRWDVCRGLDDPLPSYEQCFLFDSIEEARAAIPAHLVRLERLADDNPSLVEVYS